MNSISIIMNSITLIIILKDKIKDEINFGKYEIHIDKFTEAEKYMQEHFGEAESIHGPKTESFDNL